MNANVLEDGDFPIFDFFELDERAVVINRSSDAGWVWSKGAWQEDNSLVERCYAQGGSLSEDAFVHSFPYAALALLDVQQAR